MPQQHMNIKQIDLNDKRQVEDFLHLPFSIYKDFPEWVPSLQMDERLRLNSKMFPLCRHSHTSSFAQIFISSMYFIDLNFLVLIYKTP